VTIALDRQQRVPGQVYDLLRERIQSVELAPGTSINERMLADWLGVSRTPIREAIRRLADDGLIRIIPNVGTSVSLVDPRRIVECWIIRTSLEAAAIEESVKHFTKAHMRRLEAMIEEQDETIESGDMVRNISVDSEFHQLIVSLSGFPTIADILQKAMGEIVRARHLSIKLPGRLREPIIEHRNILEALRSGDPKRCSAAIRDHLDKSYSSILRVIDTNPDFLEKVRD
jgi:GntR family transcriptional regulator, rspAB operon transcriptional repressor